MPKKITSVGWSASNVPYGMVFSETTGTFEGTPEDEGEYVVPVKVRTNYGEDQKDVLIVVESKTVHVSLFSLRLADHRTPDNPKRVDLKKYAQGISLGEEGITEVSYSFKVTNAKDGNLWPCWTAGGTTYYYKFEYDENTGYMTWGLTGGKLSGTVGPIDKTGHITITTNKRVYIIPFVIGVNTHDLDDPEA